MNTKNLVLGLAVSCTVVLGSGRVNAANIQSPAPTTTRLVSGLQGGSGSTVGPDGALYVAENAIGSITRVDPRTGITSTFASGLPPYISDVGIGGVMDVAFIDKTAYALVTLVDPSVGGNAVDGIYRIDGLSNFTIIADIGQWSIVHPPTTTFDVPTGVQYALQPYRGGFLVTDGHHNRVLWVKLNGTITQVIQFDDIVPTGLAVSGNKVYMAEAGPIPHLPATGKVVSFGPSSPTPIATQVAAGAPLLVDVEMGRNRVLYALSMGTHTNSGGEGSPADPNTGYIVKANANGTFTAVSAVLDRPTSLEIIGNTAYVVTLTGEIWKIDRLAR